ncbi:hypothetical protein WME89_33870 [Sorangium sp. So ce321]|uniref:hypothetical protein n=1 Tax=Sorangium sp. So ce321 TaxID=3133300 RepID=UPI003F64479B
MMVRHALKSFGLSALFLAGLMSLAALPGCVASSEESPCELGEPGPSGASEGACDEEESADESAEEAPPEQEAPTVKAPSSTPQAMCSPICDRI